jgi:hypothetical protein
VQNQDIKMIITDVWWKGVDWINLAQNSVQWRISWRWLYNLIHEVQKTDANAYALSSCIMEFR